MSLPTSVGLPTPRRHNSSSVIQQTSLWGPVVYTSNDRDMLRYSSARASQQAQHVPSLHDRSSDQVSSQRLTSTRSSKAIGPLPYYAVPRPQKSNTSQHHHHHHHHHNSSSAHRSVGAGGGAGTSETSRLVNGTSPRSSKAMHAVPLMTSTHGIDPAQLRRHSMMSLSLTPTTLSSTGSANGKEGRVNHVQAQGNVQVQPRPNVRSSPAAAVPLRINENNNSSNISGNTAGTTNEVSRGQNITVLSVYSPVASDDPRLRPHYQKVPQSRSPLPASMPLPHGTPTRSDARASAPPSRLPTAVRETLPSLRPPLATTTTRPRYGSAPSARPTTTNTTTTPVCTPMSSAGDGTNNVRRPARQECKATQTEDRSYLTALPSQPPRSSQSMDQPHKESSTPLYVNHTASVPSSAVAERGVDVASQTNPQDISQQPARSSKAGPAQPLVPYAPNTALQPQARIAAAQPLAVSNTNTNDTPVNLPPRPTPPGTQVRIHTNTLTTTQHKVRYVRLEDEFDPDAPDPSDMGVVEAARYAQRIQQQEEEEANGGQVGVPRGAYMSDGHAWVRRSDRGPVASTRHPLRITDTSEEEQERGVQPTPGPAYVMVPTAQSHPHRDINGSEVNIIREDSEAGHNAINIEGTTTPYGIYNKAGGYLLQRHVQQAVTGPLAAGTSFAPPPQPRLLHGAPPPQIQQQQQYEEGVNEAGKAMRRVPLSATSQPAKASPSALYVNNESITPYATRGNTSAPARHRFEGYNHYTFTETPQPPSTPQLQNHNIQQQQQQNSNNAMHSGPRVVVASPSYRNAGPTSGQSPYYNDTQYDEERPYEAYAAHRRIHTRDTPGNEYDEYADDEDEEEDVLSEPRTPERCSRQATGSEVTYKPLSEQRTESAQAVRWNGQRTTTGGPTHTAHERHHGGGMTTANIRHGVRSTRNREERHTSSTGGGGSSSEHNYYYNSSNNGGGGGNNNGRSSSCDTNTQPAMLSERDSKDAASEAEEDDVALAKPRPQHLIIDEEVYTLPIDQAHPEATLRLSRSDFEQGRMAMYTNVNHDPNHDTNEAVVQEESAQREEEEEESDSGDDDVEEEESAGIYESSPT